MKNTKIIIGILISLIIIAVVGDIYLFVSKRQEDELVSEKHSMLKNVYCSRVDKNETYNLEKHTNYKVYNTKNTVYIDFLWIYAANSEYDYDKILQETEQLKDFRCSEEKESNVINCQKSIVVDNEEEIKKAMKEDGYLCLEE